MEPLDSITSSLADSFTEITSFFTTETFTSVIEDATETATETFTSSFITAFTTIATATATAVSETATATLIYVGNDTDTSPFELDPGGGDIVDSGSSQIVVSDGNPFLNFVIGMSIVLAAAALNAFGLNLTKLDHTRTLAKPKRERRRDWLRPLWVVGMLAYIISQLFGSTLSLRYLRSDWVAPLGSTSLVFNILFGKWLVGTPVTKQDIRGTALIVLAVILILVFSSINHGLDGTITVSRLSTLWSRPHWLIWFAFVAFFTFLVFSFTSLLNLLLKSRASLSPTVPEYDSDLPPTSSGGRTRAKKATGALAGVAAAWAFVGRMHKALETRAMHLLERGLESTHDAQVRFFEGIGWAVVGGSLAGGCLVFTKAVVKLLAQPDKPFGHFVSIITCVMVALTAVLQIICLNKALKAADSTLVVPLFYAGYTILGFVNSLIFMNETGQYETWVLVAIFISIALLVGGVVLLSLKKPENPNAGPNGGMTNVSGEDASLRMDPISGRRQKRRGRKSGDGLAGQGAPMGMSGYGQGGIGGDDEDVERGYGGGGAGGERGMWEVGSVSDEDDSEFGDGGKRLDGEDEPRASGVGGSRGVRGERGGLLFDEEAEDEDAEEFSGKGKSRDDSPPPPDYGDETPKVGQLGTAAAAEEGSDADSEVMPWDKPGPEDAKEDPFGDFEGEKK